MEVVTLDRHVKLLNVPEKLMLVVMNQLEIVLQSMIVRYVLTVIIVYPVHLVRMLIVVVMMMVERHPRHHHQPVVTSVPHQPHVVSNKHANVKHDMVVELHLLLQLQVPEVDLEDQRKEGFGVVRLVQNNAIAHPGHRISVVFILLRV